MADPGPFFSKLVSLAVPLLIGALLAAGAMSNTLENLTKQVAANTADIGDLESGYGRVDERLKAIKETLDRVLIAVEKN